MQLKKVDSVILLEIPNSKNQKIQEIMSLSEKY